METKNCFKCVQPLSGVILVLGTTKGPLWDPDFPAHLQCLYDNICIFGGDVDVSRKGRNSWTHHHVEKDGELYHTHVRTMLDHSYRDERGWIPEKARYCNTCKVDCGSGKPDPFFYCARQSQGKQYLLWLKCNKCFTQLVGDWKCEATTASGATNRNVPTVHLYGSLKVFEDNTW